MTQKKLVIIDNYDSFTYNLVQLFSLLEKTVVKVYRNDKISLKELSALRPDGLIISPGPKNPDASGISKEAILYFSGKIPVLGVCLGMQCINEVYGGETIQAPLPCHGKRDTIIHKGEGLLKGLPSPLTVARYHSLIIVPKSEEIIISAKTKDNLPMAIIHKHIPSLWGVQFHPESFMTEQGSQMAQNFIDLIT